MRTTVTVGTFPYPKRFGIVGYFAGQMQIRLRHTDKELASQTVAYLLRNRIPHTIQFCRNGAEIIELLGDSSILKALKAITIKKQIVRLENKLMELTQY